MSYTMRDLEIQVGVIDELSRKLGILTDPEERLVLSEGSKVNGIAFRLHTTNVQRGDGTRSTGHNTFHPAGSSGYLGMTKADAHRTLYTIAVALSAVEYAQRQASR